MIAERYIYHQKIRGLFYKYLDETISETEMKELQTTIYNDNNVQWAPQGTNIIKSTTNCPNLCRYCYVQAWKLRKDKLKIPDIEDVRSLFVIDEDRVNQTWTKRRQPKLYIFPSTHDIFPENVDDYIIVAKKIMDSGSEILLVSKPRIECIKKICDCLIDYKNKIMLIFTITSNDNEILKEWEPLAPIYEERIECVKYAYEKGYNTSVSMEPFLSDPIPVINDVQEYVTHCIWIGSINHCKELEFTDDMMKKVDELSNKKYIVKLVNMLKNNKKVYWKYKIMRIIGLKGKKS